MKFWSFLSLLLLVALTACGTPEAPAYQGTLYTPPPTPGGRLCMNQCNESRDYCQQSCDLDYRACYVNVQAQAQRSYDQYTKEHFDDRTAAPLLPSDFDHPDDCNKTKKSCIADCVRPYDSCYRSCGGTATVTSSCQFLCFE